ncbi:MAG: PEP-CTERM sorting domain-containing protein [Verrucomicrobiia bacterium]
MPEPPTVLLALVSLIFVILRRRN